MKNLFFIVIFCFFAFISCRNDDFAVQRIDQIINLYIDSAGQDMLNSNIKKSYSRVQFNDVYGLTDTAPVNFSLKKNNDTISYVEYLAGAKRRGVDSVGEVKTYESKIALILTKKINDSTTVIKNDTMTIQYISRPEIFQVSRVWYNRVLTFTKVEGEPNIVKVRK